ncbi:hypothetical protein BC829DRAFT_429994 [Chytridium lagenaria]|nr:hypothetical protein BC829DRAFT_429994 [Chytridium lagenaria]
MRIHCFLSLFSQQKTAIAAAAVASVITQNDTAATLAAAIPPPAIVVQEELTPPSTTFSDDEIPDDPPKASPDAPFIPEARPGCGQWNPPVKPLSVKVIENWTIPLPGGTRLSARVWMPRDAMGGKKFPGNPRVYSIPETGFHCTER